MNWTKPVDLRAQVQKLWESGRLLADIVDEVIAHERPFEASLRCGAQAAKIGEQAIPAGPAPEADRHEQGAPPPTLVFPMRLRLRGPSPRDLGARFDDVRDWIRDLENGSRIVQGAGYDIEWQETSNRLLGRNTIPCGIVVPTRANAFAMIEAADAADRFFAVAVDTLARFPGLSGWLRRYPLVPLAEIEHWDRILSVLDWFRLHPRSGLYARQIDVAGVDTKFIAPRKALLGQLLDQVLSANAIDSANAGSAGFEQRYGLAGKPAVVRIRVLDSQLSVSGLTDITARVDELALMDLTCERVFIVENEITGLAFPPCAGSILIFGGGYAIDRLAALPWLRQRELFYWGDIDTHGFAMLDRLRGFLPDTRSLLMDRQTLIDHRQLWTFEDVPHVAPLTRLTSEEGNLYDDLRFDRLGRGVRLEQERVPLRSLMGVLCRCRAE